MATITTKFDLGDVVYKIRFDREELKLPCRDCRGAGWVDATLADGKTTKVECPNRHHDARRTPAVVSLGSWPEWRVDPDQYMIGQLQIRRTDRNAAGFKGRGPGENFDPSSRTIQMSEDEEKYMCWETGVGSGNVHDARELFADLEVAEGEAERRTQMARAGHKIPGSPYGSWQPTREQIRIAGGFLDHRELYEHEAGHVLLAEAIVASGSDAL